MNAPDSAIRRPVRSFVRREGRITRAQKRALVDLWPLYGIDASVPIDFTALFGRDAPVFMEIGFGNGETLTTMAARAPGTNFLGAEVYGPGVGSTLLKIHALQLPNVRICRGDAVQVLQDAVPRHSLTKLLIFFPDPWPKKRHHKRRLIQPAFVELAVDRLLPGGCLHLATDWQDYADHMMELLGAQAGLRNAAGPGNYAKRPDYRPPSKYERRGRALGHSVRDLVFERC